MIRAENCPDCGCCFYHLQHDQEHLQCCDYCGLQRGFNPMTASKNQIPAEDRPLNKKAIQFNKLSDFDKKVDVLMNSIPKNKYFFTSVLTREFIKYLIADKDQKKILIQQNEVRCTPHSKQLGNAFQILDIIQANNQFF